jgi:ppGpp synthetase/RelA/SpoT-type nucleotidyltranferase
MPQKKGSNLTKTQVNKAGKVLRTWWGQEGDDEPEALKKSVGILLDYRASHQVPLTKATVGLRSRVVTAKCMNVEVSQRLKRVPTILDKLRREPNMALANMQDIGGCRAVLTSIDEIRRVQKRLAQRTLKVYDYVDNPRASGYRGVHVIVQYDGRLTEVQLRTGLMHQWAYTVERLSGRMGVDLKAGKGPAPVLEWLQAVSRAMALEELGHPVDTEGMKQLGAIREAAVPFMGGGS